MPISKILEASLESGLYAAKAWVNFNGTGTVAIRASGNVSSITDNGTGDYTVNFTNAMPDANYSLVATAGEGTDNADMRCITQQNRNNTSSASRIRAMYANGSASYAVDVVIVNVSIFR